MSDRTAIDEIRNRISIVETVSEYVTLKKAGDTYKALCPFHTEKTPSFVVNDDRGYFKCFGCNESGDVFSFLMKITGQTFPEVLSDLGRRTGVEVRSDRKGGELSSQIHQINSTASAIYQKNLASPAGEHARNYLAKRGINPEMIAEFGVGLSLPEFRNLHQPLSKKFSNEAVAASGLFRQNKNGNWYDLFRDRIIFPIRDNRGRIVAFGGRLYRDDAEGPKYINSPETEVYTKGKHIFGLDLGREACRRADSAVLVEGYTDVIVAHKHGFRNVVAALGTALTPDQVGLLKRFVSEIILAYDSDAAGRKAALRGIDIALDKGLRVRIATMPDNQDPADALEAGGAGKFERAMADAKDFLEHRIAEALQRAHSPLERAHEARELLESLKGLTDRIARASIIKVISERFGVSEDELLSSAQELIREAPAKAANPGRGSSTSLDPELSLLKLVLEEERIRKMARNELAPEDFSKPVRQEVFRAILDADETGHNLRGDLGGRVDELGCKLLAHIATAELGGQDRERLYRDFVKTVKVRRIDDEINDCTVLLRQNGLSEDEHRVISGKMKDLFGLKRGYL